jgi:circadian clock protein KaiC
MSKHLRRVRELPELAKTLTGISGFDEITHGGLPRGRPTLVAGGAGCGKTLFSMEFLVWGAIQFGEPGLFMSFEENDDELTQNVASLGFDLEDLIKRRLFRWLKDRDQPSVVRQENTSSSFRPDTSGLA